ncbi:MAG: RDD family protein [Bacteroidota bacterium]
MPDILDHNVSEQTQKTYTLASKGQRFANYIIDIIAYTVLSGLIGGIIGALFFESVDNYFLEEETSNSIRDWVVGVLIVVGYYTASEYWLKGKTLGKYITRTRAVQLDNSAMNLETVLKRSIIRVIPFEALSFLGDSLRGWHDKWSDTKVIRDENWEDISPFR